MLALGTAEGGEARQAIDQMDSPRRDIRHSCRIALASDVQIAWSYSGSLLVTQCVVGLGCPTLPRSKLPSYNTLNISRTRGTADLAPV